MKSIILLLISAFSMDMALARLPDEDLRAMTKKAATTVDSVITAAEAQCSLITVEDMTSCREQVREEVITQLSGQIDERRMQLYTVMTEIRLETMEANYTAIDAKDDTDISTGYETIKSCTWYLAGVIGVFNHDCTLEKQKDLIELELKIIKLLDTRISIETSKSQIPQ